MKTWACNWESERFESEAAFEIHMDAQHSGWRVGTIVVTCAGCGTSYVSGLDSLDLVGERCMHCPSIECPDCGEPDDRTCSCWVSIESMSLADKKALFAADGTFNIGVNGEVTVG